MRNLTVKQISQVNKPVAEYFNWLPQTWVIKPVRYQQILLAIPYANEKMSKNTK